MRYRAAIFLLVSALTVICVNSIRSQAPPNCPIFKIVGPSGIFAAYATVTFELRTTDPKDLKDAVVEWRVSSGIIVSGAGTSSIKYQSHVADSTNVTISAAVTTTNGCKSLLSGMWPTYVIKDIEPIDEFGKISRNDLLARIDNFYSQLSNNPAMEGAVIVRFDTHASPSYKRSWIERFIGCLAFRKYDPSRITFLLEKTTSDERTMFTSLIPAPNDSDFYVVVKAEEIRAKLKDLFR